MFPKVDLERPHGRVVRVAATTVAAALAGVTALVAPANAATKPVAGKSCASSPVGALSGNLACTATAKGRTWQPRPIKPTGPTGGVTILTGAGGKDALPIGVALALTGSSSSTGTEQLAAVQAAEAAVNAHGGINGRPIRLVIADTGVTDAGALTAVTGLIDGGAVAIVGPTLSSQAFAVGPVAEKAKVTLIAPSGTAAGIPQLGRYIARIAVTPSRYAATSLAYVAKTKIVKTAVLIAGDDAASQDDTTAFTKALRDAAITVQAAPVLVGKSPDFAPAVRLVASSRPDAVVISASASAAPIVRMLRGAGFRGEIIASGELGTASALSACGADCEGLWFSAAYAPTTPATGVNQDFRSAFRNALHREPTPVAAQAYSSVQVVTDSLRALDGGAGLSGSLATLRTDLNARVLAGHFDTPLGSISFDADGDLVPSQFYIVCTHMVRGDTSENWSGELTYLTA